jgi:hypothetical protein
MKETDVYYSLNDLLSYNAEISIAFSIRDLGKSYSAMCLVEKTIKDGRSCVWSRWDRDQTLLSLKEYLDFTDNEFSIISPSRGIKVLQPKDDNLGSIYFIPVKDAAKAKGIDQNFRYWIYDEFLPEFYLNRVQKEEEYDKWASLYTTLKRDTEDFRAILMSNCISWFNGYFRAWGIRPFPAGQIKRFKQEAFGYSTDVVMHNVKPSSLALDRVIRHEVAKGKSEEEITRYIENATQDKGFFIGKCPDLNVPLHPVLFIHHGQYYGFREYEGHIYFCKTKYRDDFGVMALNRRELSDGMARDRGAGANFERWINLGIARFENVEVMNAIIDLVYLSRERL